jgi:hypothetical protein
VDEAERLHKDPAVNPYEPTGETANKPIQRPRTGFQAVLRFGLVLILTLPLAMGFQMGGMLLTGSGEQGFGWLIAGILVLPTLLACSLYMIELSNARRAIVSGTMMGILVSLTWLLLGFALIIAAGPMDGGI